MSMAENLNPVPINAPSGAGIVHTVIATIGGVSPITAKTALKIHSAVNPRTHGTNISGFSTIGRPYIIGSAILKIVPGSPTFPNSLYVYGAMD